MRKSSETTTDKRTQETPNKKIEATGNKLVGFFKVVCSGASFWSLGIKVCEQKQGRQWIS